MASELEEHKATFTLNIIPRCAHIGVVRGNFMFVWGGYTEKSDVEKYLDPSDINVYNIEHNYWTKYSSAGDIPPGTSGASACFVEGYEDLYLFGGHTALGNTNCLYKLDLKTFTWTDLSPDDPQELCNWPSPRDKFAFWSYDCKLFCFGGFGPPLDRWLNDNGKFVLDTSTSGYFRGWNNQLLEYDLRTGKWSNPPCKGNAPLARAACTAVRLGAAAYLFGGRHVNQRMNDLHCFSLEDYAWSGELQMDGLCPVGRSWHTLTALSDHTAFLFGGYSNDGIPLCDGWLLDVTSLQWTLLDRPWTKSRLWHTSCCSDDGEVLVFGGCCNDLLDHTTSAQHSNEILVFLSKPPSLQRCCLQAAFKHRDRLQDQWDMLPWGLANWLHRHSKTRERYLLEILKIEERLHTMGVSS